MRCSKRDIKVWCIMQCYDYSFREICLDVVIDLAERHGVEMPGAKSVFFGKSEYLCFLSPKPCFACQQELRSETKCLQSIVYY